MKQHHNKNDITSRLRAPINALSADDLTYEAADEIERLRKEISGLLNQIGELQKEVQHARNAMVDVDVHIDVEADRRTNKHGSDLTTLVAVKVVTEFVMTPDFVHEAQRGGFQYQALGDGVASSLKNAVEKAKGVDILSIARFYPVRPR